LKALVIAGSDSLPSAYAPWLAFDTTNSEVIFNCDVAGYEQGLSNPINIYLNTVCNNLFSSFESHRVSYSNDCNGMNELLVVRNANGTNVIELTDYSAIQCYQDYSCTVNWNCIQSIVICSSTLPINGSLQCAPKVFGQPSNLVNQSGNVNLPIISDFIVALDSGKEYQPAVDYVPTGQYRLVDLSGHSEISTISLELYYQDRYGNLHQLLLGSNCNSNIKIMFRKKYLGV
jgi:hypothetical protein